MSLGSRGKHRTIDLINAQRSSYEHLEPSSPGDRELHREPTIICYMWKVIFSQGKVIRNQRTTKLSAAKQQTVAIRK